ncbi:MAG: biotin/lipoyl-binding protein [Thermoguttaceae bacterium]|jgi:multidrug efflux pump subunit AcrA (membrane-fusion protein)|nr:biotin/lipoyl-binding protein [Thermoguttaceae bacterium]
MPSTVRAVLPVLILVVGIVGYLALATQRPVETQRPPADTAPLVEVIQVMAHDAGLDITTDGVVVPYREITMAAEVAGRVTKKAPDARAGNYVAAGTLLLEIDPRDYELAVKQLQQELAQAGTSLGELDIELQNIEEIGRLSQEQLDLHTVEYERQQKLAERRVVTATQLDQTRQAVLQSQSQVIDLRKQMQMLRARRTRLESLRDGAQLRLERAQLDLDRTRVTAPGDGVVVRDMVEVDSLVNKGTELFVFEDTSKVEVRCNLLMDELYWLWLQRNNGAAADVAVTAEPEPGRDYQIPRTPATIVYELAGQKYAWQGELSRFDGIGLDDATRMAPCRVAVEQPRGVRLLNPGGPGKPPSGPPALVRGMFVAVRIHARPNAGLLRVPEEAIRPGNRLWLLEDGRLQIAEVRVVQRHKGYALVRPKETGKGERGHQVSAGMRVITSPLAVAEAGMHLREQQP